MLNYIGRQRKESDVTKYLVHVWIDYVADFVEEIEADSVREMEEKVHEKADEEWHWAMLDDGVVDQDILEIDGVAV